MQLGAIIEQGPADWTILQQTDGGADIRLSGSWHHPEPAGHPTVYIRLVREDSNTVVVPWRACEQEGDQARWTAVIPRVPAGGLYRIETCLNVNRQPIEWSVRGDMVHHIGVGDLFVVAGQSNASGFGRDAIYDPPELGVHVLRNRGTWDLASHPLNESTRTAHIDNREGSNGGHSPYLSFARLLKRELGYPIGLISAAAGGSRLGEWEPDEQGVLYRNLLRIVGQLEQPFRIRGVLWYQGCSDASLKLGSDYLARFSRMVAELRREIGQPGLPILTVQLNRLTERADADADRSWGRVREAQRQAARVLSDVYVVPSTDCGLSDAIHNSSLSNLRLGERLGRLALRELYGRPAAAYVHAPQIVRATREAGRRVRLLFEHVHDRLEMQDTGIYEAGGVSPFPFRVEDERGTVPIAGFVHGPDGAVELELERDPAGQARVHGCFEQNPAAFVPFDLDSHLPMLSFYDVPIFNEERNDN